MMTGNTRYHDDRKYAVISLLDGQTANFEYLETIQERAKVFGIPTTFSISLLGIKMAYSYFVHSQTFLFLALAHNISTTLGQLACYVNEEHPITDVINMRIKLAKVEPYHVGAARINRELPNQVADFVQSGI